MNLNARSGARRLVHRERGVTLVIALIFMVVLTLLGVGMVRSTTSEERMSANARDVDIAFSSAEAALRAAEIRVQGSYSSSASVLAITAFPATPNTCASGLCVFDASTTTPIWLNTTYTFESSYATILGSTTTGDVTSSPKVAVQGVTTSSVSATQPRYFIELARKPSFGSSNPKDAYFYRISSKGYGARNNSTQLLLQEGMRVP